MQKFPWRTRGESNGRLSQPFIKWEEDNGYKT